MRARAAIATNADWRTALSQILEGVVDLWADGTTVDLAFVFATSTFTEHFPAIVGRIRKATGAKILIGCSGQGVIGLTREAEGEPAISLLVLSLPGTLLRAVHFTQDMLDQFTQPSDVHDWTGVVPDDVNAWVLFADPFRLDCEGLVNALTTGYAGVPVVGGLASGDFNAERTHVFLNGDVFEEGGVGLAIGGNLTVHTVISQGCTPIGEPWTITGATGHVLETISNRPAYELLAETFHNLSPEMQGRAQGNVFAGLVIDEYRDEFRRGDFLIRNLLGADPRRGGLAIGAHPRIGQTIQFQLRDADAADADLRALLDCERRSLAGAEPLAAILCSCNGRGTGLFGTPDHDANTVAEYFQHVPLAGLFCNGEIGPVGRQNFIHGYTASLALLLPTR